MGLCQYSYAHAHKCIAQLCARMSINDIPDHDGHVHTYVHHEIRSLIQRLTLMRLAIKKEFSTGKIVWCAIIIITKDKSIKFPASRSTCALTESGSTTTKGL